MSLHYLVKYRQFSDSMCSNILEAWWHLWWSLYCSSAHLLLIVSNKFRIWRSLMKLWIHEIMKVKVSDLLLMDHPICDLDSTRGSSEKVEQWRSTEGEGSVRGLACSSDMGSWSRTLENFWKYWCKYVQYGAFWGEIRITYNRLTV